MRNNVSEETLKDLMDKIDGLEIDTLDEFMSKLGIDIDTLNQALDEFMSKLGIDVDALNQALDEIGI